MRALLIVNPGATTTTARTRDVLTRALRSEIDLEIGYTRERGHAAKLAQEATADKMDVVVALGGDGTVNEVVNGLLADAPPDRDGDWWTGHAATVPALAVVPGGATNVFARAIGLPKDWAECTGVILEALRERPLRTRTVGLGMAEGRYFTFCAGAGIDADVINRVEEARRRGHVANPALYLASVGREYFSRGNRHRAPAILEWPGAEPVSDVTTVIVQNTSPWTYLGSRPVDACPEASFDTGLDLMAVRGMHLPSTVRTAWQMLGGSREVAGHRDGPHGRRVLRLHDLPQFTLRTSAPIALQVDGDFIGAREAVSFTAVASALRVIW